MFIIQTKIELKSQILISDFQKKIVFPKFGPGRPFGPKFKKLKEILYK